MRKNFDLPSIKKRLAGTSGEKFWRSLDELAETDEFKETTNETVGSLEPVPKPPAGYKPAPRAAVLG